MPRNCENCGTKIPWGVPQCVECGSFTHWRSRLASMGIAIGGGTVLVVVASIAWVRLASPPKPMRAAAEVQELLRRIGESADHALIGGAGHCKTDVANALCVQTTEAYLDLAPDTRQQARQRVRRTWKSIAELNPNAVVFVGPDGTLQRE